MMLICSACTWRALFISAMIIHITAQNTHELSAADGGASPLQLFTVGLMTTDDLDAIEVPYVP